MGPGRLETFGVTSCPSCGGLGEVLQAAHPALGEDGPLIGHCPSRLCQVWFSLGAAAPSG